MGPVLVYIIWAVLLIDDIILKKLSDYKIINSYVLCYSYIGMLKK